VIQSGGAFLEQRRHYHHTEAACQSTVKLSGWTRDRLRQIEIVNIFGLTEIKGIVQFLQNDELRAIVCQPLYAFGYMPHIGFRVFSDTVLEYSYFHNMTCFVIVYISK